MVSAQPEFEIEFRWKEQVIYWEGAKGCVFQGAWGVNPLVTIVPDATTWDRVVPPFLLGRHDEVLANLRSDPGHDVREERDDSKSARRIPEVNR